MKEPTTLDAHASGATPNDGSLRAWAGGRFEAQERRGGADPLSNPVRETAFHLACALEEGEVSVAGIERAASAIAADAVVRRMTNFAESHRARDLEDAVDRAMCALSGLDDRAFIERISRTCAGIVFTAHPTFANGPDLREAMAHFASDRDEARFRVRIEGRRHQPAGEISLSEEHEEVLQRVSVAQAANRNLIGAIVRWVRSNRPAVWRDISPAPVSLATWVGYDLDGRTDIHWGRTFEIRLREKARQLGAYADQLDAIAGAAPAAGDLATRLRRSAALAARQADAFAGDLDDPAVVTRAANMLTDDHPDKVLSLGPAIAELDALIGAAKAESALALVALRSEMILYGLGVARIHLRVNAAQVRSALRTDLGITSDSGFIDRTALTTAAAKAVEAKSRKINFASIFREKMTARRQLMLCRQILTHVDKDSPIRFLVAECEAPATIMGAVYLARLYGVDDKVDVSPLFETPEALESGGRFMERLLRAKEFQAYVLARRRVSIQLGFSDSGRFMGQVAANLAIERLHILLAREMGRMDGEPVEALVFNTHGESMGRGGYPGTLEDRFDHLMTPWVRARFEREGIHLNAEASFQGGDGFLHFQTQPLADSTLCALFDWAFRPVEADRKDLFYRDINFSWDIYRAIKKWQEELFANDDYQTSLGAFAVNFLYKTGSRKSRRQSGSSARDAARSLRAIPHNAILQQLAAPCNVSGGFGVAAAREPDRFLALLEGSGRMARLHALAGRARSLTSLSVLRAYASIYDPSFWMIRARHAQTESRAVRCERVSAAAMRIDVRPSIEALANTLSSDRRDFDEAAAEGVPAPTEFSADLYALHAMRMALMIGAAGIAASAPDFSDRHGVTRDDVLDAAMRLELAAAADMLARVFPVEDDRDARFPDLHEEAPIEEMVAGYAEIHRDVIEPLRAIDGALKEITAAVAHFYEAFG